MSLSVNKGGAATDLILATFRTSCEKSSSFISRFYKSNFTRKVFEIFNAWLVQGIILHDKLHRRKMVACWSVVVDCNHWKKHLASRLLSLYFRRYVDICDVTLYFRRYVVFPTLRCFCDVP